MKNHKTNKPRGRYRALNMGTKVSHIYDNSARGVVSGYDQESNVVFVDFEDGKNQVCLPEELRDMTPPPPKRVWKRGGGR